MLNTLARTTSRFLWLNLLMLLSLSAHSQTSLTQKIDKALKARCLDKNQTSVSVVALPSGEVVYARNTDKPLLPASVMKLVTTAAALHYLGPEYRFKTEFLYSGKRKGSLLQGDLIIRGGGDPRLSTEDLWGIATKIKASGINEITGNLVVDMHFFDEYDRAPAWKLERTQRPYDAKLSVLSLNFNTIAVHVQPGARVGDSLNVWLEPPTPYIDLHNTAKTTKRGRKNTVWVRRSEKVPGKVEIRISGKLPISVRERVFRLNVDNPTRYAAETFRVLLLKAGVKINGETIFSKSRISAKKLYEHFSQTLSLTLKELNTYSNNMTAEQVVKTIAAVRFGTPGSHAEGLRLMRDFLRLSGVNLQGVELADGSGLSRKNSMTSRAITDLLTSMFSRFDISPDFLSVMRVMGAYGVLSKRLAKSPARGKIRAKTGTLSGVSTLAGYVESKNGKVFGYALFLNNNKRCGGWGADKIEDSIVSAIYEYGDSAFERSAQK
ncbi:MAG: D-alanyl-D-alanine carboxypeptidase/D-alanyl-D-alanine-endopeptidase [Pseudomonadota bacterium]